MVNVWSGKNNNNNNMVEEEMKLVGVQSESDLRAGDPLWWLLKVANQRTRCYCSRTQRMTKVAAGVMQWDLVLPQVGTFLAVTSCRSHPHGPYCRSPCL